MKSYKWFFIIISCLPLFATETGWIILRKIRTALPKSVATVCVENDNLLSGIIYYPSLLPYLTQSVLYTFAELGFVEDKLLGIVYSLPIRNNEMSGLLVGCIVYDVGNEEIWYVNKEGEEKSVKYSLQRDLLATISYGTKVLDKITIGGSVKFVNSSFADNEKSVNAISYDFVTTSLVKNFVISLAIQNFGFSNKFVETTEKLPSNISFTCGYNKSFGIKNKIHVSPSVDLQYLIEDKKLYLSLGTAVDKPPLGMFFEYKFNTEEGKITFGIGAEVKNFSIYYSFIPSTFFSSTHCISFCIKFK